MKRYQFIIFFAIVLTSYMLMNYYIYVHAVKAFEPVTNARMIFSLGFLVVILLFPFGRISERIWNARWIYRISELGSFWLAAMLYFFLISFMFDMLGVVASLAGIFTFLQDPVFQKYTVIISGAGVFLLLAGGYINARNPRVKKLDLTVPKNAGNLRQMKIVAVSDIHMGSIIGEKRVAGLVRRINAQDPDLVLFAGDILDEDTGPVIHQNLGSCLERIHSKYGVYATTGNHEFIGGVGKAVPFLENHNINVLKDSWKEIDGRVIIAGRLDRDAQRYSGFKGKSLSDLLAGADMSKPIIVLDHQPARLEESAAVQADLHLSGHTHHGQIWPLQYLTSRLFEISWGYRKIGNTHFYVSSGFGTWGPPVRIGNRPEIVVISLHFEGNSTGR